MPVSPTHQSAQPADTATTPASSGVVPTDDGTDPAANPAWFGPSNCFSPDLTPLTWHSYNPTAGTINNGFYRSVDQVPGGLDVEFFRVDLPDIAAPGLYVGIAYGGTGEGNGLAQTGGTATTGAGGTNPGGTILPGARWEPVPATAPASGPSSGTAPEWVYLSRLTSYSTLADPDVNNDAHWTDWATHLVPIQRDDRLITTEHFCQRLGIPDISFPGDRGTNVTFWRVVYTAPNPNAGVGAELCGDPNNSNVSYNVPSGGTAVVFGSMNRVNRHNGTDKTSNAEQKAGSLAHNAFKPTAAGGTDAAYPFGDCRENEGWVAIEFSALRTIRKIEIEGPTTVVGGVTRLHQPFTTYVMYSDSLADFDANGHSTWKVIPAHVLFLPKSDKSGNSYNDSSAGLWYLTFQDFPANLLGSDVTQYAVGKTKSMWLPDIQARRMKFFVQAMFLTPGKREILGPNEIRVYAPPAPARVHVLKKRLQVEGKKLRRGGTGHADYWPSSDTTGSSVPAKVGATGQVVGGSSGMTPGSANFTWGSCVDDAGGRFFYADKQSYRLYEVDLTTNIQTVHDVATAAGFATWMRGREIHAIAYDPDTKHVWMSVQWGSALIDVNMDLASGNYGKVRFHQMGMPTQLYLPCPITQDWHDGCGPNSDGTGARTIVFAAATGNPVTFPGAVGEFSNSFAQQLMKYDPFGRPFYAPARSGGPGDAGYTKDFYEATEHWGPPEVTGLDFVQHLAHGFDLTATYQNLGVLWVSILQGGSYNIPAQGSTNSGDPTEDNTATSPLARGGFLNIGPRFGTAISLDLRSADPADPAVPAPVTDYYRTWGRPDVFRLSDETPVVYTAATDPTGQLTGANTVSIAPKLTSFGHQAHRYPRKHWGNRDANVWTGAAKQTPTEANFQTRYFLESNPETWTDALGHSHTGPRYVYSAFDGGGDLVSLTQYNKAAIHDETARQNAPVSGAGAYAALNRDRHGSIVRFERYGGPNGLGEFRVVKIPNHVEGQPADWESGGAIMVAFNDAKTEMWTQQVFAPVVGAVGAAPGVAIIAPGGSSAPDDATQVNAMRAGTLHRLIVNGTGGASTVANDIFTKAFSPSGVGGYGATTGLTNSHFGDRAATSGGPNYNLTEDQGGAPDCYGGYIDLPVTERGGLWFTYRYTDGLPAAAARSGRARDRCAGQQGVNGSWLWQHAGYLYAVSTTLGAVTRAVCDASHGVVGSSDPEWMLPNVMPTIASGLTVHLWKPDPTTPGSTADPAVSRAGAFVDLGSVGFTGPLRADGRFLAPLNLLTLDGLWNTCGLWFHEATLIDALAGTSKVQGSFWVRPTIKSIRSGRYNTETDDDPTVPTRNHWRNVPSVGTFDAADVLTGAQRLSLFALLRNVPKQAHLGTIDAVLFELGNLTQYTAHGNDPAYLALDLSARTPEQYSWEADAGASITLNKDPSGTVVLTGPANGGILRHKHIFLDADFAPGLAAIGATFIASLTLAPHGRRFGFTVPDFTNDRLAVTAHPFLGMEPVTVSSSGGSLPTGLSPGIVYWVLYVDNDHFALAATPAGPPINISSAGTGTLTARVELATSETGVVYV